MQTATTSITSANISVRTLGVYGIDEALAAFDSFSWEDELREAQFLDEQGKDCVSPDTTFSISPFHFTATISERRSEIDVELCVPKSSKLLGLVPLTTTKFFHFKRVSRQRFEELLRAFFSVPHNEQFQWFSQAQDV
jgi:hypothetical protein